MHISGRSNRRRFYFWLGPHVAAGRQCPVVGQRARAMVDRREPGREPGLQLSNAEAEVLLFKKDTTGLAKIWGQDTDARLGGGRSWTAQMRDGSRYTHRRVYSDG